MQQIADFTVIFTISMQSHRLVQLVTKEIETTTDTGLISIDLYEEIMKLALLLPFTTPPIRKPDSIQNLYFGNERNYRETAEGPRTVVREHQIDLWDGTDRRQQERRQTPRRQENQEALLDTRSRQDRRRNGRRATDQLQAGGLFIKA